MEPVNYYEIPGNEPAEIRLSVPRAFILAVYHRMRLSNMRNSHSSRDRAKRLRGRHA